MYRKHNSTLTIRLPREEKAILNRGAEENRLSLSAYIRSKIFKDYVQSIEQEETKTASQLAR